MLSHDRQADVEKIATQKTECKHSIVRAGLYFVTEPAERMLLSVAALECLECLMQGILHQGSQQYEVEQDANAKRVIMADGSIGYTRSFPILDLAQLTVESAAMYRAERLLSSPDLWSHATSNRSKTPSIRCFGFRTIGSVRPYIHETFVKEARSFPTKGYLALSFVVQIMKCDVVMVSHCVISKTSSTRHAPYV